MLLAPPNQHLTVSARGKVAVKAGELLQTVRRVASLEAAVADCSWVVGTTSRALEGRRRLSPDESAAVRALKLPGVGFAKESRRYYPRRELAAHFEADTLRAAHPRNDGHCGRCDILRHSSLHHVNHPSSRKA